MKQLELNPQVDQFLLEGCMRCKYGATPMCKVHKWVMVLEHLRQIALECGLKEELKWSSPVYTYNGKNIISVSVLKDAAIIGFFKGALLSDLHKLLMQQGNIQSGRIIKFTETSEVQRLNNILKQYILEAIEIEEKGLKVEFNKSPQAIPSELQIQLEEDPSFKNAFFSLTPGRQRGYILYFAQAKQSATRIARIEKYKQHILDGIGLNDQYRNR